MLPDKCTTKAACTPPPDELPDDLGSSSWTSLFIAPSVPPAAEPGHSEQIQLLAQRIHQLETVIRGLLPLLNQPSLFPRVELKRSQLDRYCLPVFEASPEPRPLALSQLVRRIEAQYPRVDGRALLSCIRRWFRKKREEVGLKITTALRRMYPDDEMMAGSRQQILAQLEAGTFDTISLIAEARLALDSTLAVVEFCNGKLVAHLQRQALATQGDTVPPLNLPTAQWTATTGLD